MELEKKYFKTLTINIEAACIETIFLHEMRMGNKEMRLGRMISEHRKHTCTDSKRHTPQAR